MLDSDKRDELTERIERAQISAIHRALDQAWALGHDAGKTEDQGEFMEAETVLLPAEADHENLLILIANLVILGFMLKLYTEVFKDKAIDQRSR